METQKTNTVFYQLSLQLSILFFSFAICKFRHLYGTLICYQLFEDEQPSGEIFFKASYLKFIKI